MPPQLGSVWLQELTWEDVAAYLADSDLILCPVGSTEEHGPAGPLGLDCLIAIPWTSAEQRRIVPTGSFSPSIKASPEKGKAYHDYMVDQIVRFIGWLREYEGPVARV